MERFTKSLKEECVWQHRFESLFRAQSVVGSWTRHDNTEWPHQALR
jgi:putative transposase